MCYVIINITFLYLSRSIRHKLISIIKLTCFKWSINSIINSPNRYPISIYFTKSKTEAECYAGYGFHKHFVIKYLYIETIHIEVMDINTC